MLREISAYLNIWFLNSHSFQTDLEMKTLSECNNLPVLLSLAMSVCIRLRQGKKNTGMRIPAVA